MVAGLVLVTLLTGLVFGASRLAVASALTVSYTSELASRESLITDVYETFAALTFFRSAAERLTIGVPRHGERLQRLLDWTHDNVRPQTAAPTRIVSDNFYDIIRRGFGYCDQSAHVFATLAHFAGYDARLLFLRRADGVSPHSVAQIRLGDKWIVADPWLGVLWRDEEGALIGVEDIEATGSLIDALGYASLGVEVTDFARATPFHTFPYQSAAATIDKVASKLRSQPLAPPPSTTASLPSAADMLVSRNDVPSTEVLLAYDNARRTHLEGRLLEAVQDYRLLQSRALPIEVRESVAFFVALALLRAGRVAEAIMALEAALNESPKSVWRNSLLYYRGLAHLELGDREKARASFSAAVMVQSQAAIATLLGGN